MNGTQDAKDRTRRASCEERRRRAGGVAKGNAVELRRCRSEVARPTLGAAAAGAAADATPAVEQNALTANDKIQVRLTLFL